MTRRAWLDLPPASRAAGRVRVPGSKSISIRALLLAAQADGRTVLENVLVSDDTRVMVDALRALGVAIVEHPDPRGDSSSMRVEVDGARAFHNADASIFVGNSGLTIRTLVAALAFAGGRYRLHGVARMHERPIGDLVDALVAIGARIGHETVDGYPPLVIEPPDATVADGSWTADDVHDGARLVRVKGRASSQFLTGLLQAAPSLARKADLVIDVDGPLISRPYVDLTIALMERFGVVVRESSTNRFRIGRGARYTSPGSFDVEGDASSASYLLAAGLLGGGPVRVDGVGRTSLQGDARFADVLVAMGAEVAQGEDATEVRSSGRDGVRLRPIDASFNDMPDVAMTAAVLALFASGPSTLRDIGSWRVKETDRLAAMATELAKFGARVETGDDWLEVTPSLQGAVSGPVDVDTYDDHRMAMCFSLAPFLGVPVRIHDPACVAKTFPDYFDRLRSLTDGHAAADEAPPDAAAIE